MTAIEQKYQPGTSNNVRLQNRKVCSHVNDLDGYKRYVVSFVALLTKCVINKFVFLFLLITVYFLKNLSLSMNFN